MVKYNVKNGNFTYKAAGKSLTGQSQSRVSNDARNKIDSNRISGANSNNRNSLQQPQGSN